jgi:hypothetical protein
MPGGPGKVDLEVNFQIITLGVIEQIERALIQGVGFQGRLSHLVRLFPEWD